MFSFFSKSITIISFFLFVRCSSIEKNESHSGCHKQKDLEWCIEGIVELKPGDILVKPNINFMPGSSGCDNGWGFGHVALVVEGYSHSNIDSLLARATIVESMARDVPQSFQVRKIAGLVENGNAALNNTSFCSKYSGNRYRLRLKLTESQIDSIIAFALDQRGDLSCWNSMKSFPKEKGTYEADKKNWADNSFWYCSLLIWQSVFFVTGIDLDVNGGYQVYPNDLINSAHFKNDVGFQARARF